MDIARELADLLLRWLHVIAGIMWIGNSLLFNWLDRNLEKKPGIDGEIWLLHSGGFYQIEKKMLKPGQMPRKGQPFNSSALASAAFLPCVEDGSGLPPSAQTRRSIIAFRPVGTWYQFTGVTIMMPWAATQSG